MTIKNTIRNGIAIAATVLALTLPARAQTNNTIRPTEKPTINGGITSHIFVENAGVSSQDYLKLNYGDNKLLLFGENVANNSRRYGFDLRNTFLRSYGTFKDLDGSNTDSHNLALFFLGSNKSFIGGEYENIQQKKNEIVFAGTDLANNYRAEITGDKLGAVKGVFSKSIDNLCIAIGGGRNHNGTTEISTTATTPYLRGTVRTGNRLLDARFVLGKVPKDFARVAESVTEAGNEELSTLGNPKWNFTEGKDPDTQMDFSGVFFYLGNNPGDVSLYTRIIEDFRIWADVGCRIGSLGQVKDSAISLGAYRNSANETYGARASLKFSLGKNLELQINGSLDKEGNRKGGAYAKFGF